MGGLSGSSSLSEYETAAVIVLVVVLQLPVLVVAFGIRKRTLEEFSSRSSPFPRGTPDPREEIREEICTSLSANSIVTSHVNIL